MIVTPGTPLSNASNTPSPSRSAYTLPLSDAPLISPKLYPVPAWFCATATVIASNFGPAPLTAPPIVPGVSIPSKYVPGTTAASFSAIV